jgi:hypothetical protein
LWLAEFLEDCIDPVGQLVWRKRFEDVFNCASFQASLDFGFLPLRRKENYRYRFECIDLLHFPAGLITGHLRHAHVHHDQVRTDFLGFEVSFFTVGCGDYLMACIAQCESDQVSDIGFVFCN